MMMTAHHVRRKSELRGPKPVRHIQHAEIQAAELCTEGLGRDAHGTLVALAQNPMQMCEALAKAIVNLRQGDPAFGIWLLLRSDLEHNRVSFESLWFARRMTHEIRDNAKGVAHDGAETLFEPLIIVIPLQLMRHTTISQIPK